MFIDTHMSHNFKLIRHVSLATGSESRSSKRVGVLLEHGSSMPLAL